MPLNSRLYFLLLNTDISLRHGGGGMLQELLYQGNVIVAVLVDLRGIELPEAVGTDASIAQIITDQL